MRRRQWDPPKPAKDDAAASLTAAEHVALSVLTGMRHKCVHFLSHLTAPAAEVSISSENSIPAGALDSDVENSVQLRCVQFGAVGIWDLISSATGRNHRLVVPLLRPWRRIRYLCHLHVIYGLQSGTSRCLGTLRRRPLCRSGCDGNWGRLVR